MSVMTDIVLFHSVLGVRAGVINAAETLRSAGHQVHIVDQYYGQVFDDYDEAGEFATAIGFPELMRRAAFATSLRRPGFVAIGFSNGAGMAQYVASTQPASGVVMVAGALPMTLLGVAGWPRGVCAQVHYATGDPHRNQAWIDELRHEVEAAAATLSTYDYPCSGHLFTDESLSGEYDPGASDLLWDRVLEFCGQSVRV